MTHPIYHPREYLSVTTLMDFIRCPRRYMYKKMGLVQDGDEPNQLSYGNAMHMAVPILLTQGLEPALKAFSSIWKEPLADERRSLRRAQAQLAHYHHTHTGGRSLFSFETPPKEGRIELGDDVSPFECAALLDIGLEVPLFVRIDGLVKHRDTGDLWGWEFKTASRIGSSLFENLEMHPQILTYTLVLRTLTGMDVKGMMAEAMLIDKSKVENLTHPIPVKEHLLEGIRDWLKFYGGLLLECEKAYIAGNLEAFVRNFAGCSAYPHFYTPSWMCDYASLCKVDPWTNLLPLYDIKPMDHLVQLTKGESNA